MNPTPTSEPFIPPPRPPTFDERYGEMCANIAASPGNDDEIEALGCLLDEAFALLTRKQKAHFFRKPEVADIAADASKWAEDQENESAS